MSRADAAKANFMSGKSCAQAVLLAFSDLISVDEGSLKSVSAPFGAGMGRLRLTCGSVSGMVMALGLLVGDRLPKNELYAAVQELSVRFSERNGSIICGELLRGRGVRVSTEPCAEARTEDYYKKRPCPDLCYDAADILEKYLIEKNYFS